MDMLRWSTVLLAVCALIQMFTVSMFIFRVNPVIGFRASDIHKANGLVLAFLMILHFSLNWTWFKAQFLG